MNYLMLSTLSKFEFNKGLKLNTLHMQQSNLENQSDFFQLVLKGSGVSWLSDRRDEGLLAVSCQGQDHE